MPEDSRPFAHLNLSEHQRELLVAAGPEQGQELLLPEIPPEQLLHHLVEAR